MGGVDLRDLESRIARLQGRPVQLVIVRRAEVSAAADIASGGRQSQPVAVRQDGPRDQATGSVQVLAVSEPADPQQDPVAVVSSKRRSRWRRLRYPVVVDSSGIVAAMGGFASGAALHGSTGNVALDVGGALFTVFGTRIANRIARERSAA